MREPPLNSRSRHRRTRIRRTVPAVIVPAW